MILRFKYLIVKGRVRDGPAFFIVSSLHACLLPQLKYQEFFNVTYAEGAIDRKTKHLIALGASLAAGCDP